MKQIPDSLPEKTDWLLLYGNNISTFNTVNSHINDTLYHLSQLDLHGNSLKNISVEVIDGFIQSHSLLYLDISNNKISHLPENIKNLTSLKTLKLAGNIFKCSCENFWMKEWLLNETQVVDDYENIKCLVKSGNWISVVHMDKTDMGCVKPINDVVPLWKILGKTYVFYYLFVILHI